MDIKGNDRPYDGMDLLPFVNGDVTHRSGPLGFELQGQAALIDNEYKIYSKDKGENFELYNILEDVGERNNLANEQPQKLHEMVTSWRDWKASVTNSSIGNDY